MDEKQANEKLEKFLERVRKGLYSPNDWKKAVFELKQLPNNGWLAFRQNVPNEGILLFDNTPPVPFYGALGSLVPQLGQPQTGEFLLGSAQRGRYQIYQKGLAIWEEFSLGKNIGYPVATWNSPEDRARKCEALVAFFDIRGFTNWSSSEDVTPKKIQDVIWNLEGSLQNAFSGTWCMYLFTKGTGDGLMVVSEETWCAPHNPKKFLGGHGSKFCRACAETVIDARRSLPEQLAIGCGITAGEITQLYVLGRPDYTGPAVNEASKIQSVAYDEICISEKVINYLSTDGIILTGKSLPGKKLRVDTGTVLKTCE